MNLWEGVRGSEKWKVENGVECYSCYSATVGKEPYLRMGRRAKVWLLLGVQRLECVLSGGSLGDDFLRPHGVSAESENIDTGSGKLGMMHHECRVVDVETKQLAAHDVYVLQLAGAVDDKTIGEAVVDGDIQESYTINKEKLLNKAIETLKVSAAA